MLTKVRHRSFHQLTYSHSARRKKHTQYRQSINSIDLYCLQLKITSSLQWTLSTEQKQIMNQMPMHCIERNTSKNEMIDRAID